MKNTPVTRRILGALLPLAMLLGVQQSSIGGISGSGYFGEINRFASIIIGGEKFETDDVLVVHNASAQGTTVQDLVQGQRVYANVDLEARQARVLVHYDIVRGPLRSITVGDNGDSARLRVLGQTINIDLNTLVHDKELAEYGRGDRVAVDGWRRGNGTVVASSLRLANNYDAAIGGRIRDISGSGITVNGTWIEVPQLEEYRAEGWLTVGAPVWANLHLDGRRPTRLNDGKRSYLAATLLPLPSPLINRPPELDAIGETRTRLTGTLTAIHPDGRLEINGQVTIQIEAATSMLDRQQDEREFGPHSLRLGDQLRVILSTAGSLPAAKRIVRIP